MSKIDVLHHWIGRNLLGCALAQYLALNEDADLLGKTEHQLHVVFDDEHRDVVRQCRYHIEHKMRIRRRHASRRFIEEQNRRLERERYRDLHETLAAVGQALDRCIGVVGEPKFFQQRVSGFRRLALQMRAADQSVG